MTPAQLIEKGFRWQCIGCGEYFSALPKHGARSVPACKFCGSIAFQSVLTQRRVSGIDLAESGTDITIRGQFIEPEPPATPTPQFPPCTKELPEHGKFLKWLRDRNLPYIHANPCKKGTTTPGVFDFIVPIASITLFIEFKTATGRLTKAQADFMHKLTAQGLGRYARIVRSFEEAVHVVETLSRPIS